MRPSSCMNSLSYYAMQVDSVVLASTVRCSMEEGNKTIIAYIIEGFNGTKITQLD